jgi:pyruvate dehydrogenase E1 component
LVPDQIAPWIPGVWIPLGTDGFGRSDTRKVLRRFFEVDAEIATVAVLWGLQQTGALEAEKVERAIRDLGIDPEKTHPQIL